MTGLLSHDDRAALAAYTGITRLFPLPNLVLFPTVDQGLHVFEPRYRQMTADALADDQLLTLVLLKPDWEAEYDEKPAIESVGCLGRIVAAVRLADGRYDLHVRGLARVRIEAEVPAPDKLYRVARACVVADASPPDLDTLALLRRGLREAALGRFDPTGGAHGRVAAVFDSDLPLPRVCDLLAHHLPLAPADKQRLLAAACPVERTEALTRALLTTPPASRAFPPQFSDN